MTTKWTQTPHDGQGGTLDARSIAGATIHHNHCYIVTMPTTPTPLLPPSSHPPGPAVQQALACLRPHDVCFFAPDVEGVPWVVGSASCHYTTPRLGLVPVRARLAGLLMRGQPYTWAQVLTFFLFFPQPSPTVPNRPPSPDYSFRFLTKASSPCTICIVQYYTIPSTVYYLFPINKKQKGEEESRNKILRGARSFATSTCKRTGVMHAMKEA